MPESLIDLLSRRGSAALGTGDFSLVIADPACDATAIKIGHSLADGWPAWAAFARAAPGPHVPVVHALRWFWTRSGVPLFYLAEVERLGPAEAPRAWLRDCPAGKRDPLMLAAHVDASHPGIAALLRRARQAFPAGSFDMGSANWLERSDGTLVLNDPLSWRARAGPTTQIRI